MSPLSRLRYEREEVADKAAALNARYPSNVAMPAAEAKELDRLLDRLSAIDAEVRKMQADDQAAADSQFGGSASAWTVDGREVRALRTSADFRRHYRNSAAGAQFGAEGAFTIADFVRGVAGIAGRGGNESVRAALSVGTDADGGHLVPHILMPGILEALVPASSVLSAGASILPFEGVGAKSFTYAGIDNIPTAAWRLENGAIAESEPTFRATVAVPKSLAFFFKVSRELLADGAGLQQALTIAIAQSFAKELDRVALLGTGTDPQPRGLLNLSGVHAVANGANGASLATTKFANFFTASQAIMDANAPLPRAAIMSNRSAVTLGQLVDTTGQPLQRPQMLQEIAFLSTSQIPNSVTVGTSSDCSTMFVGDFANLFIAMRENVSLQRVEQLFATTGQIGFIGHVRADILVTYPKAFAVVSGVRP